LLLPQPNRYSVCVCAQKTSILATNSLTISDEFLAPGSRSMALFVLCPTVECTNGDDNQIRSRVSEVILSPLMRESLAIVVPWPWPRVINGNRALPAATPLDVLLFRILQPTGPPR
jgi:hypothetical protein